jgi:beta-galactosidase/beta-glucuronidase
MRTQPLHRMHLKGPWSYEWLDGPHCSSTASSATAETDSPLLADSRVRMPSSWQSAFGSVSGRVLFRRRFQRPTNLDPNERVHIAFDGLGGQATIAVNGQRIGSLADTTETVSFDITSLLEMSNELTVELSFFPDGTPTPGGLREPVAVEIHLAAPGSSGSV